MLLGNFEDTARIAINVRTKSFHQQVPEQRIVVVRDCEIAKTDSSRTGAHLDDLVELLPLSEQRRLTEEKLTCMDQRSKSETRHRHLLVAFFFHIMDDLLEDINIIAAS